MPQETYLFGMIHFKPVYLKAVEGFDNVFYFIIGQRLITGNTEFGACQFLGDGKPEFVPTFVTALAMGSDGIMEGCFDTVVVQVLLQGITTFAENRKDVMHVVGYRVE